MKLYSVHLCCDESKKQECQDIEVTAETIELAHTYALARHPGFDRVRVQSELGEDGDWIDYQLEVGMKKSISKEFDNMMNRFNSFYPELDHFYSQFPQSADQAFRSRELLNHLVDTLGVEKKEARLIVILYLEQK